MPSLPVIHWFRTEAASQAGAPPLVLLHGFTGSPRSWEAVVRALPGVHAVAAPALPGHHPAAPVSPGFEANVDWLAGVLEEAGLTGCHLAGYSLGARTALGLALRHAHIPARLTLIGVHPGLETPADRARRVDSDRTWIERLRSRGIQAFVDAWARLPLFASQERLPAETRARQQRIRLGHDAEGLARSLEHMGLGAMPDYDAHLGELAMPVTLVAGALDCKFTDLARAAASRLPGARVALIAGSGHNLPLEVPDELAAILSSTAK